MSESDSKMRERGDEPELTRVCSSPIVHDDSERPAELIFEKYSPSIWNVRESAKEA